MEETPAVVAADALCVCMSGSPCGGAAVRKPEQETVTFIAFVSDELSNGWKAEPPEEMVVMIEGAPTDARPGGGLVVFNCKFSNMEDNPASPPGEEAKALKFPNSPDAPL